MLNAGGSPGLNTDEVRDGKIPVIISICFEGGGSGGSTVIDVYCKPCSEVIVGGTPVPDVKANGLDGPVTTSGADILTVTVDLDLGSTVALDSGSLSGDDNADWWVVVNTPFGWFHYDLPSDSWIPGLIVTFQGSLFNLTPPYTVLSMSGLPSGIYTFYFGVDLNKNGTLDTGTGILFFDSVVVNITP